MFLSGSDDDDSSENCVISSLQILQEMDIVQFSTIIDTAIHGQVVKVTFRNSNVSKINPFWFHYPYCLSTTFQFTHRRYISPPSSPLVGFQKSPPKISTTKKIRVFRLLGKFLKNNVAFFFGKIIKNT